VIAEAITGVPGTRSLVSPNTVDCGPAAYVYVQGKEDEVFRKTLLLTILTLAVAPLCASTLDDLQTAYNGESTASAKYTAFADKAKEEGYPSVASLFRAAARAEQIHADNHAAVITKMGGTPALKLAGFTVKTTAENLKNAVEGETYERDTMYPGFLKTARAAGDNAAVKTFTYARTAEGEHAKLYTEALTNLDSLKGKEATFYVCTVCGYTTASLDFERCRGCNVPKDKYVAVS
jgi:rubrerythrin